MIEAKSKLLNDLSSVKFQVKIADFGVSRVISNFNARQSAQRQDDIMSFE